MDTLYHFRPDQGTWGVEINGLGGGGGDDCGGGGGGDGGGGVVS